MGVMHVLTAVVGALTIVSAGFGNPGGKVSQFVVQADLESAERQSDGNLDPEKALRRSVEIIKQRLDALSITNYNIAILDDDRLIIEISGLARRELVESILGIPAKLEFRIVALDNSSSETANIQDLTARQAIPNADGSTHGTSNRVEGISGINVVNAISAIDNVTHDPVVVIIFDERGTERLAELTTAHVGELMEIVLQGEVVSTPVILEPILEGTIQSPFGKSGMSVSA